MPRLTTILCALALGASAAHAASARLYFDLAGGDGDTGVHPGATAMTNPVAQPGERLYIYWQFGGENQNFPFANYRVRVVDGEITQAWNYNHPDPTGQGLGARWNAASPNPPVDPNDTDADFLSANVNQFGLKNTAAAQNFDVQHAATDGPFGSTLLGFVDVIPAPDATAAVFFDFHPDGGLPDEMFFGFGDGPNDNPIPDATVVPEPGTLALLTLAALALGRRRRA